MWSYLNSVCRFVLVPLLFLVFLTKQIHTHIHVTHMHTCNGGERETERQRQRMREKVSVREKETNRDREREEVAIGSTKSERACQANIGSRDYRQLHIWRWCLAVLLHGICMCQLFTTGKSGQWY